MPDSRTERRRLEIPIVIIIDSKSMHLDLQVRQDALDRAELLPDLDVVEINEHSDLEICLGHCQSFAPAGVNMNTNIPLPVFPL